MKMHSLEDLIRFRRRRRMASDTGHPVTALEVSNVADLTTDAVPAMACRRGDFSQAVYGGPRAAAADLIQSYRDAADDRAARVERRRPDIMTAGKVLYTTEGCTQEG